ncbi:MAG: TIGR01777 family oxidoreductase [Solirubrobacteraceae bacterium]|nr:TIGR01777 family oxidoreductase [Solirubrobacteraceae bacterium]
MRITVTGATGGIGSLLVSALIERGDEVTVLSRNAEAAAEKLGDVRALAWNPADGTPPLAAIEHADAIVNLAGESVAQRWSTEAKQRILDSRVLGTRHLVQAIATVEESRRPVTLVSGSAIGFYGDRHQPTDETAPAGTDGFLPRVATAWEAEARKAEALGLRVVLLRSGDVLAAHDGLLPILSKLTKFGVMGPLGGGKQPFPWIHVVDEVGLILHAVDSHRANGPINAVAPGLVTQGEFARCLGKKLHRPAFMPAPGFAVKLLRGEMAELILEGAAATPAAARELGYSFAFPDLPVALDDLLD